LIQQFLDYFLGSTGQNLPAALRAFGFLQGNYAVSTNVRFDLKGTSLIGLNLSRVAINSSRSVGLRSDNDDVKELLAAAWLGI